MIALVIACVGAVTDVTPWGGESIRGDVTRADACGLSIKLEGAGAATVWLEWSDVRDVSPVAAEWTRWIEAGDALRRGGERLGRGDAARAAESFALAVEAYEGARGACVRRAWEGWATALRLTGHATAAMAAHVRAIALEADDTTTVSWPAELCPVWDSDAHARDAEAALKTIDTGGDERAEAWRSLLLSLIAAQRGEPSSIDSRVRRAFGKDDPLRAERVIMEAWMSALSKDAPVRARSRESLADLGRRTDGPLRHWCRVAVGQSLLRETTATKPGSVQPANAALDAARQFLTVVASDDPQVPGLSAVCASLGAQALERAGDERGASSVRSRLIQPGASP